MKELEKSLNSGNIQNVLRKSMKGEGFEEESEEEEVDEIKMLKNLK